MVRAVRRPRAADVVAAGLLPTLLVGLSGCAGIGQPAPYDSQGINGLVIPTPSADPADFVEAVDNPWLPLGPGERWTYDVVDDSGSAIGSLVVDVGDETIPVGGLEATVVETTTDLGGGASRVVTDLYAQDEAGNVWLVGQEADGEGWRAGEGGAEAGLVMPADPRLGDGWRPYAVPGLPEASTIVEDLSRSLVQTRHEADTSTRNVYELGVGLVSVEHLDAGWRAELVDRP